MLTDEAKRVPKAVVSLSIPDLSDLSFPFSSDEWSKEQHSDSSLAELFSLVFSDSDVPDVARAYFCCVQVLLGRSYLQVDKSLLRRQVRSSHFGRNKMAIYLFYIKFNDFF